MHVCGGARKLRARKTVPEEAERFRPIVLARARLDIEKLKLGRFGVRSRRSAEAG